jgi:regulator of sigma E protease
MLFTIVVALFVLGVLILVHETGHFLAAKLVGIQVLRFSIGLGRPLISFQRGETEYAVSAIPFGGYVKMAGDDPTEGLEGGEVEEDKEKGVQIDPERQFNKKSLWARFLVILAGPLMNFILAMVLYMGVLYFQGAETYGTTTVESVQAAAVPGAEQIRPESRILEIDGRKVDNWNDVIEEILNSTSASTAFSLYDIGAGQNYTVSVPTPVDSLRRQLAFSLQPFVAPAVGSLIPDKPAAKAGLQPGDLILSIDGKPIKSWNEMTGIIHTSPGKELVLEVERAGARLTVKVKPEMSSLPQADDTFREVGLIGISPQMARVSLSMFESVINGAKNTVYTADIMVRSLVGLFKNLVTRKISMTQARDVLGGPVMIGQMAGQSARAGDLWAFMAFLSLNLCLLNLLPIPVLDGGHLLFLFIEFVRFGKPLSPRQRMWMLQVGLVIVLALMILATANDLRRVFGL